MIKRKNKKEVMVTGGLGFIGSHLVNRLAARNDVSKVVIIDSRAHPHGNLSKYVLSSNPKVDIHIVDITNEDLLLQLAHNCSIIYHLAAETHVQRSITSPRSFILSNTMGTFSVLEATRHLGCRLVHASTSEVYGDGDALGAKINEDHPLDAHSPYAAAKLAADSLVRSYIRTYGINATVLRMFNAYGPGQHFEKVIPMCICSALCGFELPIQGDGSATRDWNYIEDVSARLEYLLHSRLPIDVCNLASGEQMSVQELTEKVSRLGGSNYLSKARYIERPGYVGHQLGDVLKTNKYFGPSKINIDNGLKKTYMWYRDHIDLWRPIFLRFRSAIISEMQPIEIKPHLMAAAE